MNPKNAPPLPAFDSVEDLIKFFNSNDLGDFDLREVELEVEVQTCEFLEDENGSFDQTAEKNNLR